MPRASASPTFATQPLGARDYLAIAARIDTIFIDHVPVLDRGAPQRGEALHPADRHALRPAHRGWCSARRRRREELYAGRRGVTEAFEFDRTASRLIEMQSRDWLDGWAERHGKHAAAAG